MDAKAYLNKLFRSYKRDISPIWYYYVYFGSNKQVVWTTPEATITSITTITWFSYSQTRWYALFIEAFESENSFDSRGYFWEEIMIELLLTCENEEIRNLAKEIIKGRSKN